MRIVFATTEILPASRSSGPAGAVWETARRLARLGVSTTVLCPHEDPRQAGDRVVESVRILRLAGGEEAGRLDLPGLAPLVNRLRRMARYRSFRRRVADALDELIDSGDADVVEFVDGGSLAQEWMNRPRRIPMVVRCRGLRPGRSGPRLALAEPDGPMARADALVTSSMAAACQLREEPALAGIPLAVIPEPVDTTQWSADGISDHREHGSPVRIVCPGPILKGRGVTDLIDAVQRLRYQGRDVRLTLTGEWGALGRSLQRHRVSDPGMGLWLSMPGPMPPGQVARRFHQDDLVAVPVWPGAKARSCLEAMACGALLVATGTDAVRDVVRDGVDGLLAPPRDPAALAETIARALDLPADQRRTIRSTARRRVSDTFAMDVVIPRIVEHFDRVIRTGTGGRHILRDVA